MSKYEFNQSIKDNYRYYYDEATNIIFYQQGYKIIIGLADHSGDIFEKDIKKLYELELANIDTKQEKITFMHTIHNENMVEVFGYKNGSDLKILFHNRLASIYPRKEDVDAKQFTYLKTVGLYKTMKEGVLPKINDIDEKYMNTIVRNIWDVLDDILIEFCRIKKINNYYNAFSDNNENGYSVRTMESLIFEHFNGTKEFNIIDKELPSVIKRIRKKEEL